MLHDFVEYIFTYILLNMILHCYISFLWQAALLHDTIEDTDTSLEEIKKNFGEKVAGKQ